MYDYINRHAILISPKQPLLNWINALYPEIAEDGSETTIYLMKEQLTKEDTEKWLQKKFGDIFENELNTRHMDENDWPQKRTYKLFTEWFSASVHTEVLDMEEELVKKY